MARTCIYCGRELGKGEHCTCPSAKARSGAGQAGQGDSAQNGQGDPAQNVQGGPDRRDGQKTQAAGSAGRDAGRAAGQPGNRPDNGWRARWLAWRQARERQRRQGGNQAGAGRQQAQQTGRSGPFARDPGKVRRDFMMRLPSILNRLQRATRYVIRPVDAIRLSVQYPSVKRTFGFLGVLTIMSGLVFMNAMRHPQIALISGNARTLPRLLLFAEGMALGAAAILLLSLFYRIAIIFLHRRNYTYQAFFDALSPVALYSGFAMLLVFLALQTSVFPAVTIFAVGLGISHLVQFFVIRQLTNLDENHSAMLVLIANLMTMSAMGVVLSLF